MEQITEATMVKQLPFLSRVLAPRKRHIPLTLFSWLSFAALLLPLVTHLTLSHGNGCLGSGCSFKVACDICRGLHYPTVQTLAHPLSRVHSRLLEQLKDLYFCWI